MILALAIFAPALAAAPASADPCILYGFCGQTISTATTPAPPTRTPTPTTYPTPTPVVTQPHYATPAPTPGVAGIPGGWEGIWTGLSGSERQAVLDRLSGRPSDNGAFNSAKRKLQEWQKRNGVRNAQKRNPGSGHYATGTAVTAGGLFTLWLALKVYSPACGPFMPACAVVL